MEESATECLECGHLNLQQPLPRHCALCGRPLRVPCDRCGEPNPRAALLCLGCGARLGDRSSPRLASTRLGTWRFAFIVFAAALFWIVGLLVLAGEFALPPIH